MSAEWAVVTHNVAAMRVDPEGASEQISQAIMGDAVRVLGVRCDYARIQSQDEYEGWILQSQLRLCDKTDPFIDQPTQNQPTQNHIHRIVTPFADLTSDGGELNTRLVFGTAIRLQTNTEPTGAFLKCIVGSGANGFVPALAVSPAGSAPQPAIPGVSTASILARDLCTIARQFVGTPYLWGGTTPFGFDCSGFVQRVYSACGAILPRDAYLQAGCALGETVSEDSRLAAGDLVFFCSASDPRNRGITHVGMMLDDTAMIHASGKYGVTIQPLRGPEILSAYSYRGAWRRSTCAKLVSRLRSFG
jgi:cell wall-associated NlpC family hydrolase